MISFDLISSLSHSQMPAFAMIFSLRKSSESCVKLLNIHEFLEQVIGVGTSSELFLIADI
jgi:hypothetical protein